MTMMQMINTKIDYQAQGQELFIDHLQEEQEEQEEFEKNLEKANLTKRDIFILVPSTVTYSLSAQR